MTIGEIKFSSVLFAVFAIIVAFSSCKKDSGTPYSCDATTNKWVIQNQARFASYTREDLAKEHNIQQMNAIYGSLTAEQKMAIWKDKLTLVINTYGLSEAENAHIQKAIDYFKQDFWTSNETLDQFNPWAEEWAQEARTELGWDDAKLFNIAEVWLTTNEMATIRNEYAAKPNAPDGDGGTPDCDCRYSGGCWWLVQSCDTKVNCAATYHCGLFGSSRCKGQCQDGGVIR